MSPEWLTAIGTLGTFVVIAASAIAALLQLRHMRGSNQIVALNQVWETIESREFQEAQRWMREDLPAVIADPKQRERLSSSPFPTEYAPLRNTANFFEHVGVLVKKGIIDRDIACDLWGGVVLLTWNLLEPVIRNRRAVDSPTLRGQNVALWENFEFLAALSKRFIDAYPNGAYPAGYERMPQSNLWPEVEKRA